MIRSFNGVNPQIAPSAYVDESAVVIGDVVIESEASIWPHATLRGDSGQIVVGEGSNIQDSAVLHEDSVLGSRVTVGHGAIVHAATVEADSLIGMNAVVLDDVRVGTGAIVGSGAVVTKGTDIPSHTLVAGVPATQKDEITPASGSGAAAHYVELAKQYRVSSGVKD